MEALSLMATLGLDSKDYEKGLDDSKESANGFAKAFSGIIKKIAIAKALKGVFDGIVSITKAAVGAYAEYEQLAGGVDTLFGNGGQSFEAYAASASTSLYKMGQRGEDVRKLQEELIAAGYEIGDADGIYGPRTQAAFDAYARAGGQMVQDMYDQSNEAAELVKKNADEAYMTAGLSANEYMQTVTGFSASLIQSLGGDTMRAAELSDMAIRDMSDNANKMGTDMQSIQNAYAGFAKGNFTMLDNLHLGYGGTRSEMQRLIDDANRMREAQGLNADLTIDSYADIIEAIHTVQDEMGITGTTSKEAEGTIQGSLSMTKAAWQNLVTSLGSGKDLQTATQNFIKSAKSFIKNVTPIISTALKGLAELVREIAPVIAEELPGLITELLPPLLEALGTLVASIVTNLPAILSALWTGLKTAMSTIWTSLSNMNWSEIGTNILSWITGSLQNLGSIIMGFLGVPTDEEGTLQADWKAIGSTIKTNIETGVGDIADSIFGFIETAAENLKDIDWSAAFESLDVILGAIIEIAKGIGAKIVESIQKINWEEVFYNLLQALWNLIDQFGTWLGQKIQAVIDYFTGKTDEIAQVEAPTAPKGNQRIPLNGVVYELTPEGLFINPNAGTGEKQVFTAEELGLEIDASGAITFASNKPNPELGEQAQRVYDMLMEAYGPGDEFDKEWSRAIESMGLDISENGAEGSEEVGTTLADALGTGGEEGAEAMKVAIIRSGIMTADSLKKRLQTALNELKLPNFTLTPTTLGEVGHATAMDSGEILHGLTPFGIGSNGVVHFGGEAGPEAVVGVNSLNEMIQRSVNAAMANVQTVRQPINVQLLLDSGELLAAMDVGLNDRAEWRGGGRA